MKYIFLSAFFLLAGLHNFAQDSLRLHSLNQFRPPSTSWQQGGSVKADWQTPNKLLLSTGTGVLANMSAGAGEGTDLITIETHGDAEISAEVLLAKGANSGIYLQGRYEVQLNDNWGSISTAANTHGGIYERWNDSSNTTQKGFDGHAPRQEVSKPPGVWQKIAIQFRAPRFSASGQKTENARIRRLELNGVVLHENLELSGPTRGSIGAETAMGPLRIQGDHGSIALRNLVLVKKNWDTLQTNMAGDNNDPVDPILVEAPRNTLLRSFMDIPGRRIVHAVSVGSPQGVHFTYDMDNGALVQAWRGGFLDATPMWHERGDGSSRPLGSVLLFGDPVPTLNILQSADAAWQTDTMGMGFRTRGYRLDKTGRPVFLYQVHGLSLSDSVQVLAGNRGLQRTISSNKVRENCYVRLASGRNIEEIGEGMYLIDEQSYYIRVDDAAGSKAVIRNRDNRQELLVPLKSKIVYSILF